MPLSAIKEKYFLSAEERYEQGDILRDVSLVEWADTQQDEIKIQRRELAYCVVVSQECDLEHDFNERRKSDSPSNDKHLQSVLICPAYPVQDFRAGDHLKNLKMKMQNINSENWGRIRQNSNPRYHYLDKHENFQVPELAIDFKHYITVPREILYRDDFDRCYLASMEILYRESLSSRFAHYLSRIGLPDFASP